MSEAGPLDEQGGGTGDGQRSAFTAFYTAHYGRVLAYAQRRTDDAESARDVASETFLVAWRRWDVSSPGQLPWLFATAALTLRNHQRSQHRAQAATARVASHSRFEHTDHGERADLAGSYAAGDAVRRAVRQLPETDRELLMLTVWEDLSVSAAAAIAGCSPGTAHVRLHRARRRLRHILSTDEHIAAAPADQLPGSHIGLHRRPEDRGNAADVPLRLGKDT